MPFITDIVRPLKCYFLDYKSHCCSYTSKQWLFKGLVHCIALGWIKLSLNIHRFIRRIRLPQVWAVLLLKLNFLASDDISGSLCAQFLCEITYALQVTLLCLIIGNEVLSLTKHQLLVKPQESTNKPVFVTGAQVQMHKDQIKGGGVKCTKQHAFI